MKADNCSIWDLFNGAKQYVVPLFQRSYVWSSDQWETLWNDIFDQYQLALGKDREQVPDRFLGPIVVVREREKNLDKFTIIDGQQRIITLSIILAVIRAFAKETRNEELYEQINDFLKNRPRTGEARYIVIPTQFDKETLYHIFDETYVFTQDSGILECFDFFWQKIDRLRDTINLVELQEVLTETFCVVYIELAEDENPNQVFESLNYRGVPLEESDLIRNFFFIRLESQDIAVAQYEQYWKPMEERLSGSQEIISDFLRTFCMKNGSIIKKGQVFEEIKSRYEHASPDEILTLLRDLDRFSCYYEMITAPQKVPESDQVSQTILKTIIRLRLLNNREIYPFLLNCFAWHDTGRNTPPALCDDELAGILQQIEGYLIRRAVCRRSTYDYEKLFARLCPEQFLSDTPIRPADLVLFFATLTGPVKYPQNEEFEDNLRNGWLYQNQSTNAHLWVILLALEDYFISEGIGSQRKESNGQDPKGQDSLWYLKQIQNLRIEHIMPIHLTGWWRDHLGSGWENIHHAYLHRLGNLTLTRTDDRAIADAGFDEKREWYQGDGLCMNRLMKTLRIWKNYQIDQRSQIFAAFCMKIWPDITKTAERQGRFATRVPEKNPQIQMEDENDKHHCFRTGEIPKGSKPISMTIRGTEIPVKFWYQVLETTVSAAYYGEPVKFHRIIRKYQQYFSTDKNSYRSHIGVYSYHSRFGRYQVRDMCLDIIKTIGWNEDDWCLYCSDTESNGI